MRRTKHPFTGLLTFETGNDAAFVELAASDAAGGILSQEPLKRPAPPASTSVLEPVSNVPLADFFTWLKQNSIYVVSSVLVVRHVASTSCAYTLGSHSHF